MRVWLGALALAAAVMGTQSSAAQLGKPIVCSKLSAVDGDTIRCDDVLMRDMGDGAPFVSGYDTPETYRRKCEAELILGRKAKARMAELLGTTGMQILDSGEVDSSGRPLVWIVLADGRSIGSILMSEGMARRWTPEYEADWCHGANDRVEVNL